MIKNQFKENINQLGMNSETISMANTIKYLSMSLPITKVLLLQFRAMQPE